MVRDKRAPYRRGESGNPYERRRHTQSSSATSRSVDAADEMPRRGRRGSPPAVGTVVAARLDLRDGGGVQRRQRPGQGSMPNQRLPNRTKPGLPHKLHADESRVVPAASTPGARLSCSQLAPRSVGRFVICHDSVSWAVASRARGTRCTPVGQSELRQRDGHQVVIDSPPASGGESLLQSLHAPLRREPDAGRIPSASLQMAPSSGPDKRVPKGRSCSPSAARPTASTSWTWT